MTLVLTHQAMVVDLILQEEIAQEVAITVMAIGERDENEDPVIVPEEAEDIPINNSIAWASTKEENQKKTSNSLSTFNFHIEVDSASKILFNLEK